MTRAIRNVGKQIKNQSKETRKKWKRDDRASSRFNAIICINCGIKKNNDMLYESPMGFSIIQTLFQHYAQQNQIASTSIYSMMIKSFCILFNFVFLPRSCRVNELFYLRSVSIHLFCNGSFFVNSFLISFLGFFQLAVSIYFILRHQIVSFFLIHGSELYLFPFSDFCYPILLAIQNFQFFRLHSVLLLSRTSHHSCLKSRQFSRSYCLCSVVNFGRVLICQSHDDMMASFHFLFLISINFDPSYCLALIFWENSYTKLFKFRQRVFDQEKYYDVIYNKFMKNISKWSIPFIKNEYLTKYHQRCQKGILTNKIINFPLMVNNISMTLDRQRAFMSKGFGILLKIKFD